MKFIELEVEGMDGKEWEGEPRGIYFNIDSIIDFRFYLDRLFVQYGDEVVMVDITERSMDLFYSYLDKNGLVIDESFLEETEDNA